MFILFDMAKGNDKTLAVLAHILGLVTGFLGPLIIYLVAQDESAKHHAKYALNWQISLIIYLVVSIILIFVYIGFFTLIALMILNLVFSIMAAVKAGENVLWKYPLAIPFLGSD